MDESSTPAVKSGPLNSVGVCSHEHGLPASLIEASAPNLGLRARRRCVRVGELVDVHVASGVAAEDFYGSLFAVHVPRANPEQQSPTIELLLEIGGASMPNQFGQARSE
jgi:hypothetical protein